MEHGICDMHGHFLPGMDDGCKTPEESVQVLKSSYEQGVRRMFATPHYYPVEPVEAFLARRQVSEELLRQRMAQEAEPLPRLCMGAEVAFRPGLSSEEALEQLCLGRSRYLLLEMPFAPWGSDVIREVGNLCRTRGIIPIVAHIERYLPMQSRQTVNKLLEQDVLVQMNADELLRFGSRRQARKLLQSGVVQLLGTDCHNMTTRAPNLGPAAEYLRKRSMDGVLRGIEQRSNEIFSGAVIQ